MCLRCLRNERDEHERGGGPVSAGWIAAPRCEGGLALHPWTPQRPMKRRRRKSEAAPPANQGVGARPEARGGCGGLTDDDATRRRRLELHPRAASGRAEAPRLGGSQCKGDAKWACLSQLVVGRGWTLGHHFGAPPCGHSRFERSYSTKWAPAVTAQSWPIIPRLV